MFTEKRKSLEPDSPGNEPDHEEPRRRGRPPGPTAEGQATRRRLYATAIELIAERGYEGTTLRAIAKRAGVSPGLLYRYFPSKRAVVMELYDELSATYAERAGSMPRGKWVGRFRFALDESLATLAPERATLTSLVAVLVGNADEGLFAESTAFSRKRVQAVFVRAVTESSDAPKGLSAGGLGRLLYLAHLGVILFWLLDKSKDQRATHGLIGLAAGALKPVALGLRLAPARKLVCKADEFVQAGLFGLQSEAP